MMRVALSLLALAALLVGLAQLFLPGIAANVISSRIGRYGTVESVDVRAWPAIKLLWGNADSVRVRAKALSLTPQRTAQLLGESHGTPMLDVTVGDVREGPLHLTEAVVRKRGDQLTGEGLIAEPDVKAALPVGVSARLRSSEAGVVTVRVSGGLFGVGAFADAAARATNGELVVRPLSPLLGRLRMTLFADPRIFVEGVGAQVQSSKPLSYRLSMTARLR